MSIETLTDYLVDRIKNKVIIEDSVVLSREEYEKIVKYLKTYEDKLKNFPNEVNALVDMYNKGRKETAEKIYTFVNSFGTHNWERFEEFIKQFGVEIKE